MQDIPVVSIVMIFYNAAEFIEEAIDSVLTQTYSDWELLLVDDGGTDGSEAIALRYAAEHPARIRYLHHPARENRGTSATRNLGIASARGRYLTELDADDVWLPGFLERRVGILEARADVDMVFGPVQRWFGWTGKPEDVKKDWVARPWEPCGEIIEPPRLVSTLLQQASLGGVPKGLLLRREAVEEVGKYPAEFRDMYEDQALLCKLGLRYRAFYLPDWDYRYRRHPTSMVSVVNRTQDKRTIRLMFLNWFAEYLQRSNIRDRPVWKPLRRELWKCHYPRLARARERFSYWTNRVRRRVSRALSATPASSA